MCFIHELLIVIVGRNECHDPNVKFAAQALFVFLQCYYHTRNLDGGQRLRRRVTFAPAAAATAPTIAQDSNTMEQPSSRKRSRSASAEVDAGDAENSSESVASTQDEPLKRNYEEAKKEFESLKKLASKTTLPALRAKYEEQIKKQNKLVRKAHIDWLQGQDEDKNDI